MKEITRTVSTTAARYCAHTDRIGQHVCIGIGQPYVDLLTDADVQIDGASMMDDTGSTVADAGDVNGDGVDDVIIGALWATTLSAVTTPAWSMSFSEDRR